jgi:hypothetical protein
MRGSEDEPRGAAEWPCALWAGTSDVRGTQGRDRGRPRASGRGCRPTSQFAFENASAVTVIPKDTEPSLKVRLQIAFRFAPLLQLDSHGLFVPIDRDAYMAATDVDEHNRKLAPLFEAKPSPMTTTLTAKEGRLPALAPLPLPDQGPRAAEVEAARPQGAPGRGGRCPGHRPRLLPRHVRRRHGRLRCSVLFPLPPQRLAIRPRVGLGADHVPPNPTRSPSRRSTRRTPRPEAPWSKIETVDAHRVGA